MQFGELLYLYCGQMLIGGPKYKAFCSLLARLTLGGEFITDGVWFVVVPMLNGILGSSIAGKAIDVKRAYSNILTTFLSLELLENQ